MNHITYCLQPSLRETLWAKIGFTLTKLSHHLIDWPPRPILQSPPVSANTVQWDKLCAINMFQLSPPTHIQSLYERFYSRVQNPTHYFRLAEKTFSTNSNAPEKYASVFKQLHCHTSGWVGAYGQLSPNMVARMLCTLYGELVPLK